MSVFRNVHPNRHLGSLGAQTPVIYGGDSWPTPESINYLSNGGTLDSSVSRYSTSTPSSLSSFTVPQFDSRSCQQERRPCIPSDAQNQSLTIDPSCLPSRRESHGRRRQPGYIPRPRNAFIIFRSFYISDTSSDSDQQNELSKQAGKVWNRMSEVEKKPFVSQAIAEKEKHQAMYPNYTYCPGLGAARRKSRTVTKNTSRQKKKTSSTTSSASFSSSESTFPEIPFAVPTERPPRAAAQRAVERLERFLQPDFIPPSPSISPKPEESPILENLKLTYPEPASPVEEDACVPITDTEAFITNTTAEQTTFAPTVFESKEEEYEPQFDFTMSPLHLDCIPEQFGFKYYSKPTAMLAYLPPMPNTDNDTGDVPSLFTRCMTDDDPTFSPDGNITEVWPQPTIHYSEIPPPMHVPGFPWLSYHENFQYTSMLSEDTWPEGDMTVMGSYFKFEEL